MKVVDVYDGDTCTVLCVFQGYLVRWRCRLVGYDTPELRTTNKEEKERAVAAREFLKTLLPKSLFMGHCVGLDKYGRILLDLKFNNTPVSELMIDNNHGYVYNGGKKEFPI